MFPGTLWAAFKASRLSGASSLFPLFVFGLALWLIAYRVKRVMRRLRWMVPALGVAVAVACFVVAGASYAKRNNVKLLGMPFVHVGTGPNLIAPSSAAPTDLEALMATAVGRWKAEDAACNGTMGDCTDGQDVETLHDSSSGGNNFTQATAAAKPTWDADCGGDESFGCLSFDGTSDEMDAGDVLDSYLAAADFTLVVVAERQSSAFTDVIVSKVSGAANAQFAFYFDGTAASCANGNTLFRKYGSGAVANRHDYCVPFVNYVEQHAYVIEWDTSQTGPARLAESHTDRYSLGTLSAWDLSVGTDSAISDTVASLIIGDYGTRYSGSNGAMLFSELIIFPALLSDDDEATLNTYLKDTYGIVRPPPGYVADWRADQAACSGTQGDCTNGATAETLHDIGSGGNNCTNATGTDVPTYAASAVNSQPAIDLDGTDDNLDCGDADLFSGTDSTFTLVTVAKIEQDDDGGALLLDKTGTGFAAPEIIVYADTSRCGTEMEFISYGATGGDVTSTCPSFTSNNSDFHSWVWRYDGSLDTNAGLDRYVIDTDRFSDNPSALTLNSGTLTDIQNTASHLCFGGQGTTDCSDNTYAANAKMAETLIYPAVLTSAQITGLNEYLKERYDIVRPPPGYAVWLDGQDPDADGDGDVDGLGGADTGTVYGKGSAGNTCGGGAGADADSYKTSCPDLATAACINSSATDEYWTCDATAMNINPASFCVVATVADATITTEGDTVYPVFTSRNASSGSTGPRIAMRDSDSAWNLSSDTDLYATDTGVAGTLYMITGTSGSSASLRINGAATDLSGNSGATDLDRLGLFRDTDSVFETWNGSWVEGVFWDGDDFTAIEECETYFQERYGTEFWAQ